MNKDKIILGIDPGTTVTGYGLVQIKDNQFGMIAMGVIELHKLGDHYLKLQRIFERVLSLVEEFKPDEIAIEAPFYGNNVQSMLKLGRAQGVAMAAGLYRNIPIFEYSPKKIKMAVTGDGNATKEKVAVFLQTFLKMKEFPNNQLDATDALAAAICHYYQRNDTKSGTKSFKSWKDFINQNPERMK